MTVDKMKTLTIEEALQMEIMTSQALIEVLVDKGIISHKEILDRIRLLKNKMDFKTAGST